MLSLYWSCLSGGVLLALVTIIFGDILGHAFDGIFNLVVFDHLDFLQPMVLVGGITIFGGSGVLLTQYTSLGTTSIIILSICLAFLLSAVVYFAYVKPMKNSENSTGFSMNDLIGLTGEVTVPIPSQGLGEVLIKVGAGYSNQIAASLKGEEVSSGAIVIVVKTEDNVVYVIPQNTI